MRRRILHVLHTSLPHVCGYSLRSDQIVRLQRRMGLETAIVTSGQQPDARQDEVIGGIQVFRTACRVSSPSPLREMRLMWKLYRTLSRACKEFEPDLIHAHSPVLVGLPAFAIARRLRLPIVYEVRDLWENASVDRGKFAANSMPYKVARSLEGWLVRRADAVVTIGTTLRANLESRSRRAIDVVQNGVDTDRFQPVSPSRDWLEEWNPGDRRLIAYIGSFQPYEGLEVAIRAIKTISAEERRAHLLVVGDGPERRSLEHMADRLGVRQFVTFTGRVAHEKVREIYSVAEILVYPRTDTLTTRLTTPLKPLEALSMGKAVLGSDLPAMRELIDDDETGLLFEPGNPLALASGAIRLLGDPGLQRRLGEAGRKRVMMERAWETEVAKYAAVYERVQAWASH